MYQIDYRKWWAAVQAAETAKAAAAQDWIRQKYERELTILYSIRAHGRGRIHRRQAGVTFDDWQKMVARDPQRFKLDWTCAWFTLNGGRPTFPLTMEDQAALIGERWKEFAKAEEKAA